MALFDKIFKSIKTVDRAHLVEEEKLKGMLGEMDTKIAQLEFLHKTTQQKFGSIDEILA